MTTEFRTADFLTSHIRSIIDFYHPVCIDTEYGGYINQLRDDGSIFDRLTKHLVGTCRFIYNYSVASILFDSEEYRRSAAHGIAFLEEHHRQPEGGYAWLMSGREVVDGTRHCYGHAFVLLAAAGAAQAGIEGAADLCERTYRLLEERFWRPGDELYVDEISADWSVVSPYRGQNANMHMCEAMLAAYEATLDSKYLRRAETLAGRTCVDLAEPADGLVWEHYRSDWTHDWQYNLDDPKHLFRPYGYLVGHFVEWSKLLLILAGHESEEWMLRRAESLFQAGMERGWDDARGRMIYTFAPDGRILDADGYYWVVAEAIASSALLAIRTGRESFWDWYDRLWECAMGRFVDHEHGGWYRILDPDNRRYDDLKSPPSKTDYHPVAACFEVLKRLPQGMPGT